MDIVFLQTETPDGQAVIDNLPYGVTKITLVFPDVENVTVATLVVKVCAEGETYCKIEAHNFRIIRLPCTDTFNTEIVNEEIRWLFFFLSQLVEIKSILLFI